MQQRRSAAGRPSGTDGSDFSYRMVVDSRYTKVAKGKSRLSFLLLIQGLVLFVGAILMLLSMIKGEDSDVLRLSSIVLNFLSLLVCELGRRRSRSPLLNIYLIVSFVAVGLSVACVMKTNLLFEVIQSGVADCWEKQSLQLIEALRVFIDLLVKIVAVTTTRSLIYNMSPPKRSS
ncbi:uncharacterized protein LOC110717491 [Chenopodium quinoa]|uniref:Uncharacterized protein n=1 Tax=Chenopodium quinoa TaxID=63459 RepID=A0A803KT30_CHEQI|nr:uncharacterized protein LOC110717491 [Chenopodium quinoa]